MVRRGVSRWALAALALLGARAAAADSMNGFNLTGNVGQDFDKATNPAVGVLPVAAAPDTAALPAWMTAKGWVSGWDIKDIRTYYDPKADTMYVGVNTFGVAGDAFGSGTPGSTDPYITSHGGINQAHLAGNQSIAVAFAQSTGTNTHSAPIFVAGVPIDKNQAGPGLDGFSVARYQVPAGQDPANPPGIQHDFGSPLAQNMGSLAFDPSAAHPGLEFSIKNFSQLIDPTKGLWLSAYSGSLDDLLPDISIPFSQIPNYTPEQQVVTPEPTTVLAWSLMVGGLAFRFRRRRRDPAA